MKHLTAALLAATALTLTSCASGSGTQASAPVRTVTAAPVPDAAPAVSDDTRAALFVTLVRDNYPTMFLGVEDAQMIDLGEESCGQFDHGKTFNDVLLMGLAAGYEAEEMGGFLGAATAAFCPEHADLIDEAS